MSTARDIRRCALQALYQLDAGHQKEAASLIASLTDSPGGESGHAMGVALALAAWNARELADAEVAKLSPDWPTHRQPAVDRAILRLAHYEIVGGSTPPKIVINDAVELAKEFSTEKSPGFINGILDRIFKATRQVAQTVESEEG